MKTYSGELTKGMLCTDSVGSENIYFWEEHYTKLPAEVMINREWQLYKPQPKKVWGVPVHGELYQEIIYSQGVASTSTERLAVYVTPDAPCFLSKEHAEQHAKALNMANEFRLLSDVPVEGKLQGYMTSDGEIGVSGCASDKRTFAIFGVVFNTEEQAEQALVKFPKIHIANKIIQFGFHGGIVEERL